jgi:hypothetical protein
VLLAHGTASGPNFEALALAVAFVVIGVVLFVQKSANPMAAVVFVVAGVAIGVAGMTVFAGDDHDAEAAGAGGNEAYVGAVTGLCEAQRLAPDRPSDAGRVFFDQAHVPLHDLAAEVGDTDRDAAAGLLEAKESVESVLEEDDVDGTGLSEDLADLLDATVAALRAVDIEAPTC